MSKTILVLGAATVVTAYDVNWVVNVPTSPTAKAMALLLFLGVHVLALGLVVDALQRLRRRSDRAPSDGTRSAVQGTPR